MLRFLFLLPLIFFSIKAHCQTGKIHGTVVDAATGIPLEYATLIIFRSADSAMINGSSSNAEGHVIVENIPFGKYKAKIQFLGYKPFSIPDIHLSGENPSFSLGTMKLSSESAEMEEIVIQGERPLIQNSIDKKIFNMSRSLVSDGSSATDALQQVPSVTVDMDGKIALRGSDNVTILIDGKPSNITGGDRGASLDHIPASSIERIEVITNPSAKYDPEGVSGIINIVLKKNRAPGYNGQVNATAGTGNKFNSSLNLNYNTGKINIFANYSFRHNDMMNSGSSLRGNFYSDTVYYLDQVSEGKHIANSHMLRAGVDFNVNERNTLTISSLVNKNIQRRMEEISYRDLDKNKIPMRSYSRKNLEPSVRESMDADISYRRIYKTAGKDLLLSANYSVGQDHDSLNAEWINAPLGRVAERTFSINNNRLMTLKGDYALPLPKESRLEAGYISTFRHVDRNFAAENKDMQKWVNDPARSNHFTYLENIYAVYGTFASHVKGIGYQVSLRAEQTMTNAHQQIGDSSIRNDYFSLFPGLHLSRALNDKNEVQLSYSRRIARPGIRDLNPFIDYADPFNLRSGNPNLKPEYIDSYEFGHMFKEKKVTLVSSIYYRNSHDKIVHARRLDTSSGVTITSMDNAARASAAGVELVSNNTWISWWNTTASLNIFRNELQGSIGDETYKRSAFTLNAKLISNFKVKKKADLQLSYNYRGPAVLPQGTMAAMHGMDAALKVNVLKNKGSFNLTFNDVFNTRQFSVKGVGKGFEVDFTRKRESRILYLGFTYRFGNDKSPSKNQKKPQRQESDLEEIPF